MIRDKIVFSTQDPALKERLLREPKLDLQKAVDISRSSELAHKEFVTMKGADKSGDTVEVDALNTNLWRHWRGARSTTEECHAKGKRTKCEVQSKEGPIQATTSGLFRYNHKWRWNPTWPSQSQSYGRITPAN